MKNVIAIVVCIFILSALAHAQREPRVIKTFGDVSNVTCLAPEGDALWIGTLGGGMVRHQNQAYRRMDSLRGLPGNRVNHCHFHHGTLWVATESGLARFHPDTQRFVTVRSGRFLRLASSNRVLTAAMADGSVYQMSDHGTTKTHLEFAPIALTSDSEGQWVAGGMNGRIYFSKEKRYRFVPKLSKTAYNSSVEEPIVALHFQRETLLVQTATRSFTWTEQGFTEIPRHPSTFLVGSLWSNKGLQGYALRSAVQWNGGIWVATDKGVLRRNQNGLWVDMPIAEMPCGDRISALADFNGFLWIGSFDRGLCRWDGTVFQHYFGPETLPSNMINDLSADANTLYVATHKGVTLIDRSGKVIQKTKQDCLQNRRANCPWFGSINGVAVDEETGAVWLSDLGSVHRIDTKPWQHYFRQAGIRSRRNTRIAARGGRVAVGTSDQGIQIKRGKKFYGIDDQSGIADNWITDLSWDSKGRLLVATCTKGISRLDKNDRIETWTTSDGLLDDYALSISEISNSIWVGTLSGLSIMKDDKVINLTTSQGLSGNEIHDIIRYRDHVWVATDGGLSVIEDIL